MARNALDMIPTIGRLAAWLIALVAWAIVVMPSVSRAETVPPTLELSEVPVPVTEAASVVIRGVARDTGGGGALWVRSFDTPIADPIADLGWQVHLGATSGPGTFEVTGGELIHTPVGGSWWWMGDEALHVYREITGNFAISMDVAADYTTGQYGGGFAGIGILARDPDAAAGRWYAAIVSAEAGASIPVRKVKHTVDEVTTQLLVEPLPSGQATFRVCRDGSLFRTYFGEADGTWTLLDETDDPVFPTTMAVGFASYVYIANAPFFSRIDDLSVYALPSMAACTTAEQETGGGFGSGISDVVVAASGFTLSAHVDAGGNFEVEVPLDVGDNTIQLTAVDGDGNVSTPLSVSVTRTLSELPSVVIDSPTAAHQTFDERILVEGRVLTRLPEDQISIRLGAERAIPVAIPDGFEFVFDVPLGLGVQGLEVEAFSPLGSARDRVVVERLDPDALETTSTAPLIELPFGDTELVVTEAQFDLSGVVRAAPCVADVRVDGLSAESLQSFGPDVVTFSSTLVLDPNQSRIVPILATGCDGSTTEILLEFVRDAAPPQITILSPDPSAGVVQTVDNPLRVTGTIDDALLAGAVLGGQLLVLEPEPQTGLWRFEADVTLPPGVDTTLELIAWDRSGQRGTASLVARLDRSLELAIVSPTDGAQLAIDDIDTATVSVRVRGAAPTDQVFARLGTHGAVPVGVGDGTHGAEVGPLVAGQTHVVEAWVEDASGGVLARTQIRVSAVALGDVPLELVRSDPAGGARNIEDNRSLRLYFNREVDPASLRIEVRETVHGFVYQTAPGNLDLGNQSRVDRVRVDRERTPVGGVLMNLPGNRSYEFLPTQNWTFGSTVDVSLALDGEPLARLDFLVRELPTLLHGFVEDDLHRPAPGIEVTLVDAGYTAVTDANGLFSFGWGWPAGQVLTPGRHRVVLNGGAKHPRYGLVEAFVAVTAGEINAAGTLQLPQLPADPVFSELRGGQNNTLAGGRLVLGLEDAAVVFAQTGGGSVGQVAPRVTHIDSTGYPLTGGLAFFAVRLEPGGIGVDGPVDVALAIPARRDNVDVLAAYRELAPELRLAGLLGLARDTLMLVPVGIVRVDPTARRAQTVRPSEHLERLDVLVVAPLAIATLEAAIGYEAGDLDFDAVRAVWGVSP